MGAHFGWLGGVLDGGSEGDLVMDAAERAAEAIKGYCGELKTTPDVIAAIIRHEYQPLIDEVERILDGMTPMMLPRLREMVRRIRGR
jgi:hypothetical protein